MPGRILLATALVLLVGVSAAAQEKWPSRTITIVGAFPTAAGTDSGTPKMIRQEIIVYRSREDQAFVAEVPELPGCAADGATYHEAVAILRGRSRATR